MKLSPKKAAEHAGVSPQLIYKWCSEGRLPHYRLGAEGRRGKLVIELADLDAFLASQKILAPPPKPQPPKRKFVHVRLPG